MLFPKIIEYQPYSICNANCAYCPVGSLNRIDKTKGSSISEEVFNAMIEQTMGRKIKRISPHLNCEPLLCKNLPDQIRTWKKYHPNAQISFSTNCVFLTEKNFMDCYEAGLDGMELHFMGVTKDYHEKAMQTKYDKVRKNVELVLELKKKNNIDMDVYIFSHRLNGATLNQWYEFAQEWIEKGANVYLGPLWNRAGWYGKEFDEKKLGLLKSDDPHPCNKPWEQIAIEHTGEVTLCSLDYKHDIKIGNILENDIETIWNNEIMKKYQDGQNDKSKLKELTLCKDCIRGGRYYLNEQTLTNLITKKTNNPLEKIIHKSYLGILNYL